jgi:uncharacterized OB-fold protein
MSVWKEGERMRCKRCGSKLHPMVEGCWTCIQKEREE